MDDLLTAEPAVYFREGSGPAAWGTAASPNSIYIYEYSYLRTCTCGGKILYIAIYSCGAPLSTGKHSRVVVLHTDMFPGTKQTSWRGIENGKDPVTFINELPIVSRHRAIEKSEPQARDRNLSESEVKKISKKAFFFVFRF